MIRDDLYCVILVKEVAELITVLHALSTQIGSKTKQELWNVYAWKDGMDPTAVIGTMS